MGQKYLLRNQNGLWLSIDFVKQKFYFSPGRKHVFIAASKERAKEVAKEYDCVLVPY